MNSNAESGSKLKKSGTHSGKDKVLAKTNKKTGDKGNDVIENQKFECEFLQEKLYLEEVFNTLYLSFESPAHSVNAMQYMQIIQEARLNANKPLQAGLAQEQHDTEQAKEETKEEMKVEDEKEIVVEKSEVASNDLVEKKEEVKKKPLLLRVNNNKCLNSQTKKNITKSVSIREEKNDKVEGNEDPSICVIYDNINRRKSLLMEVIIKEDGLKDNQMEMEYLFHL